MEEAQMASKSEFEPGELDEILRHDCYSPEELAVLLGVNRHTIEQAAHRGELRAEMLDHHIVSISRDAVVRWIEGQPSV
jgi:excisionase family DNA binding protein